MHAYMNTYMLVLYFETGFHHFVLTGPNSPRIKIVTDQKGMVSVALKRNNTAIHMGNML